MRYILLAYESADSFGEHQRAKRGVTEIEGPSWTSYAHAMVRAGILRSMNVLCQDYTATTIRSRDGKRHYFDGPYGQTSERIRSYYVIEVNNLDEALDWAFRCPAAMRGAVEIRPLLRSELTFDTGPGASLTM